MGFDQQNGKRLRRLAFCKARKYGHVTHKKMRTLLIDLWGLPATHLGVLPALASGLNSSNKTGNFTNRQQDSIIVSQSKTWTQRPKAWE